MRLREGIDFVLDEAGAVVFTADYLLRRGFCCNHKCKNCPFREPAQAASGSIDISILKISL